MTHAVPDFSALPVGRMLTILKLERGLRHGETYEVLAKRLRISLSASKVWARELGFRKCDLELETAQTRAARQVRWAHLNMKMRSALPSDPEGLVAELAGYNPLSKKSKEFLRVPEAVKEHRAKRIGLRRGEEEQEQQQEQEQQEQQAGRGKAGKSGGGARLIAEPDSVFDLP